MHLSVSLSSSASALRLVDIPEDEFEATLNDTVKPTTAGVPRAAEPKQKPVSNAALWLWGRLLDFERSGLLDTDPEDVLETTFSAMPASGIISVMCTPKDNHLLGSSSGSLAALAEGLVLDFVTSRAHSTCTIFHVCAQGHAGAGCRENAPSNHASAAGAIITPPVDQRGWQPSW